MKNFILIIYLLMSASAFAVSHFVEKSSVEDCSKNQTIYSGPTASNLCSQNGECYEIKSTPYNCEYMQVIDEMIENETAPNYSKSETEICTDENDCQSKLEVKTCLDSEETPIKNLDLLEVYCSKFTGFDLMASGRKIVVFDEGKKSAFEASELAKQAQEIAVKTALSYMDKGRELIALMGIRNRAKGLTIPQVTQFLETFKDIKALLETGSLETAKSAINALTPDGVITTQEDKDIMISEINKFLGL